MDRFGETLDTIYRLTSAGYIIQIVQIAGNRHQVSALKGNGPVTSATSDRVTAALIKLADKLAPGAK